MGQRQIFLGGPGEGSKGQISFNFNHKVNFKDFLYQTLCVFSQMKDFVCLFVCFVALRPKSTAMVIAGRSVHLTTFSWASLNKQLTSTSCTYFRL